MKATNSAGVPGVGELGAVAFVRDHRDVPVWAVRRAEAAADAVILDHDLEVFAAMDRIDGAAGHAVRVGARAAGGGDGEAPEAHAVADRKSTRLNSRHRT